MTSPACWMDESRCAMMNVVRSFTTSAIASWMRDSVPASTLDVESSSTSIGGSSASVRAMESRCRWPPESETPRSPMTVS